MTADASPTSAIVIFEETVDTGFVFLASEYLPPPYLVRATEDSVTLNDRSWPLESVREAFAAGDRDAFARRDDVESGGGMGRAQGRDGRWRRGGGGFWTARTSGWNSTRHASRWVARNLTEDLRSGAVVIAGSGRAEVIHSSSEQHDFFVAMLRRVSGADGIVTIAASDIDVDHWNDRVRGVIVTEELRARAGQVIEEVDATAARNKAAIRANQRMETFAYPLTVLGMMLGVVALGHLLKSFSRMDGGQDNLLPTEVLRATTISIGLVVALSLFDLTWTILASQAGQMRELNPFGSRLITDPTMLIAFKSVATLVGCGLLFALRHHRRARLACWWLCLACTVLTFRWVMFNSMFVA